MLISGNHVLLVVAALLKTLLWLMIVGVLVAPVSMEATSHVLTGISFLYSSS